MKRISFVRVGIGVGIVIVLAVVARFTVAVPYSFDGNSMAGTIEHRDLLLVNRFDRDVQRGDIVEFIMPNTYDKILIKRIVGLPGEEIVLRDGEVYVRTNDGDEKLEEPYLDDRSAGATYPHPPMMENGIEQSYHPIDGAYFLLGDNRRASHDSRSFMNDDGVFLRHVPAQSILGTVWYY